MDVGEEQISRFSWQREATQQAKTKRKKKERKRRIFFTFIIRNNILQNHNVYRAIRIYDCGKCAYSNAIIVRFDRIIVRVKVMGEREAEARDFCREKLPHLFLSTVHREENLYRLVADRERVSAIGATQCPRFFNERARIFIVYTRIHPLRAFVSPSRFRDG